MMAMKFGTELVSAKFSIKVGDKMTMWRIKIQPNGTPNWADAGNIGAILEKLPGATTEPPLDIRVTISIVDKDGSKKSSKAGSVKTTNQTWGLFCFIKHQALQDLPNVLPDDTLSIMFEIRINRNPSTFVSGCIDGTQKTCSRAGNEETNIAKYTNDMGNVFHSGKFTDVTITCQDQEFNCHKAILAERSSVFEAMFTHGMKEAMESSVTIKDMDADTCQQMLQFIYSNKVEDLESNAENLLVAADKYDLKELKVLCEDHLCAKLSQDNVLDILVLADIHCASTLRSWALQFVADNRKKIVAKKEWRGKLTKYPELMEEIIDIIAQSEPERIP